MIIRLIRKLLTLPKPEELGFRNALPLRFLDPFTTNVTWEDYYVVVKERYPVRYAVHMQVVRRFWRITHRISEFLYWAQVKLHTRPNGYVIDLSKTDPLAFRTYGYLDPTDQLNLACWQALRTFVEECEPRQPEPPKPDDDEYYKNWYPQALANHLEVQALYKYWTQDRVVLEQEDAARFGNRHKIKDEEEYKLANRAWLDNAAADGAREEEMFMRLIKVRRSFWN